jgi:hypothetical protein
MLPLGSVAYRVRCADAARDLFETAWEKVEAALSARLPHGQAAAEEPADRRGRGAFRA